MGLLMSDEVAGNPPDMTDPAGITVTLAGARRPSLASLLQPTGDRGAFSSETP